MSINVPNQITLGRLVLAIVLFALLGQFSADRHDELRGLLATCFWLFLVAVLSDVLDGILARAWQQETSFGRVVDPVVDKVIVCGAFLYLAGWNFHDPVGRTQISFVQPWMVVVILLRELLVSALRAQSESQGRDFAASWVGKLKMFVQSATVCVVLGHLAWYPHLAWLAQACVWLTVIVTAASIVSYVRRAQSFLALSPPPQLQPAAIPDPRGASLPRIAREPLSEEIPA